MGWVWIKSDYIPYPRHHMLLSISAPSPQGFEIKMTFYAISMRQSKVLKHEIRVIYPHDARLDLYQVHSVTKGTDAQAEVTVRLEDRTGRIVSGHAANIDTMVASAKAYISALNKMVKRDSETTIVQNLSI